MGEHLFIKSPTGLVPAMDETQEWLAKKRMGATILCEAHEMRNGAFFRKWWSLVKYAFDEWSETCDAVEYRGQPVLPDFDKFRKDVTILAGFCYPVWNINGEMRLEAESLKWSKMTEERFTQLFDATLTALTQKVFNGKRCRKLTDFDLRQIHEQIWRYAA